MNNCRQKFKNGGRTGPEEHKLGKKYKSDILRQKARQDQRKIYDRTRISLGSAWDIWSWEEHMQTCGFTQLQFVRHLLAFHKTACRNYTFVSGKEQLLH